MMNVIRYETTALALALMVEAGGPSLNCARFGITVATELTRRVVVASGEDALELELVAQRGDQLEDASGRVVASLGRAGEWEYRD